MRPRQICRGIDESGPYAAVASTQICRGLKPIKPSGLVKHVLRSLRRFLWIAWWSLCPFHDRPEEIEGLPDPENEVTEDELKMSQWIFDQAAARRGQLEQKRNRLLG